MRKVLITPATFKALEPDLVLLRPEIRGLAGDSDKLLIGDFIDSAIEAYQKYTDNILCRSTWDVYLDEWPTKEIETPAPLATVTSIKYQNTADAQQTLAAGDYVVDTTNPLAGRIALAHGAIWPTLLDEANVVVIRITAGYATAGAIPAMIKDGLVAYIQQMMSGVSMSAVCETCWSNYRRWIV